MEKLRGGLPRNDAGLNIYVKNPVVMLIFLLFLQISVSYSIRCTVFGATGGVGQLATQQLIQRGVNVIAVTRDISTASQFPTLNGCQFVEANALLPKTLPSAIEGSDLMVINVGTTAFMTKKWEGLDLTNPQARPKNAPRIACYNTVENIMAATASCRRKPKKILLLSSIGVERSNSFPFKILNLYGILDAKRDSEDLLIEKCKEIGSSAIIVRPGRLVGAPFTNFDLAKLLGKEQDSGNRGIVIYKNDVLAGDIEREDVATAIVKLLLDLKNPKFSNASSIKLSIVNKKGPKLSDADWDTLWNSASL